MQSPKAIETCERKSLTALPSPLLPGDRAEPKGEPTSGDVGLKPEGFN